MKTLFRQLPLLGLASRGLAPPPTTGTDVAAAPRQCCAADSVSRPAGCVAGSMPAFVAANGYAPVRTSTGSSTLAAEAGWQLLADAPATACARPTAPCPPGGPRATRRPGPPSASPATPAGLLARR
jgi:hypothetical protein